MFKIPALRCLLSVFAAVSTFGISAIAQSFEVFEPVGTSTTGLSATSVARVSADGSAIIGNTSATGVGAKEYPPFVWRADTGMLVITNLPGLEGQMNAMDVANGGN